MHVQPLLPWRSILPLDIPSITAACSVMLVGPALRAFAIFHSSECCRRECPGGEGGRRRRKVFCQGCRGDRDEPDHGKKGTLDHENLLIPARRVLASLRINVGPLGLRETAARCRIRSPR